MRIIQSFWSDPTDIKCGFYDTKYHLMSWTLSSLTLSKYYGSIELFSNLFGCEILIDKLNLPYKVGSLSLEAFRKENKFPIWTLSKLYVYAQQTAPFIHIDGDIYIFKDILSQFANESLIAQNEDNSFYCYECAVNDILSNNLKSIPQGIINGASFNGSNMGIVGGTDVNFYHLLYNRVCSFLNENQGQITDFNFDLNHLSTFLEQGYSLILAKELEKDIRYLFKTPATKDMPLKLQNFYSERIKSPYVHLMGSKCNYLVCEQLAQRLRLDYPEHYNRVLDVTTFLNRLFVGYEQPSKLRLVNDEMFRTKEIMLGFNFVGVMNLNRSDLNDLIVSLAEIPEILEDVISFEERRLDFFKKIATDPRLVENLLLFEENANDLSHLNWQDVKSSGVRFVLTDQDSIIESEWNWSEENEFRNSCLKPKENLVIPPSYFKTSLILFFNNPIIIKELVHDPLGIILTDLLLKPMTILDIYTNLSEIYGIDTENIDGIIEERIRFLLYNFVIRIAKNNEPE